MLPHLSRACRPSPRVTKDMERPKYFLRIEVTHQKHSVFFSQRKYALDLLEKTRLLGCKPASTQLEANIDLWFDDSHTLDDPRRYRRLIRKLIHLNATRPDITFVVGVLRRFMHQPREAHWSAALKILAYTRVVQEKPWCTRNMDMYACLDTLTQVILVAEKT